MNIDGFIIRVDERGNEIRRDPRELRGAMYHSSGWSHNPIFVHFKKDVLDRYYERPSKYIVGDLSLIWHDTGTVEHFLPIDDDHDDKVCVLFDRLALLSDEELLHWRIYNIHPQGESSKTYLDRYVPGGIPTESNRPEHRFRNRYSALRQLCSTNLGWNLFCPLEPNDEYRLQCIRVSSADEQKKFDELVTNLTIVLIDSLNVYDLKTLLPQKQHKQFKDEHTIAWLKHVLGLHSIEDAQDHLCFLRKLQNLRSSSTAHRKGCDPTMYQDCVTYFDLNKLGNLQGFTGILQQAIDFLEFLIRVVERAELIRKSELPLLYDLNEHLHALLQTLSPSGNGGVFSDERWINETVPENRKIAHHLMTNVIDEFEGSPSDLMSHCESLITSKNPNANPSDIKTTLIDIAKKFIWQAERGFRYGMNLLYQSKAIDLPVDECFEDSAERAAYSKKLFEYCQVCVDLDEIKNCDWYRQYVAWHLSYANLHILYAYEHVLHADGLDSMPVILDAVSVVQGVADVAEKVVNVDAVRKTAKDLAQIAK